MFLSVYFFIFIFLLIFNQKINRNTLNIGLVFNSMWLLMSIFLVILKLPFSEEALFFNLMNNLIFFVFFNLRLKNTKIKRAKNSKDNYEKFLKWNKAIIAINFLGIIILLFYLKFSISDFFSIQNFCLKAHKISGLRNRNNLGIPLINRIINSFVYCTLSYNGFYFSEKKDKSNLTNIFLLIIQTIILNTKATLVFGLAFWVGGFFTGIEYFRIRIKFKAVLKLIIIFSFLILFFSLINYMRHNRVLSYGLEIKKIIIEYLIGPFSAYNLWFDNNSNLNLQYGSNTFGGVFKLFFGKSHIHGEMMDLNILKTNVYTVLKHLNNDFGKIGTICFFLIISMISNYSKRKVNDFNIEGCSILIIIYSFILTSFFSSIFRYNVNILAMVLIYFYPKFKNLKIRLIR